MEVGSFIQLDLLNTKAYYTGSNVVQLNSARAGIFHACTIYNVSKVYIPYYQCPSVSAFLKNKGIEIVYYHIDTNFKPLIDKNETNSAFLLINYFGMLSAEYMQSMISNFENVIIDNSPAFYSKPTSGCISVYSTRKFFGVPDGSYVISDNQLSTPDYPQDASSDTAAFLLKRIEKGCQAVYAERMKNEERIDKSDIMLMSDLTKALLNNINYHKIAKIRTQNFAFAHKLFKNINLINPVQFINAECIPMVYPLVIQNLEIVKHLNDNKVYTGRWWNQVLKLVADDAFEATLSKYMIPIPIDQRYSKTELNHVAQLIFNFIQ